MLWVAVAQWVGSSSNSSRLWFNSLAPASYIPEQDTEPQFAHGAALLVCEWWAGVTLQVGHCSQYVNVSEWVLTVTADM